METLIVGRINVFAIEFTIADTSTDGGDWPSHGGSRVWVEGERFGDLKRTDFFYPMAFDLAAMRLRTSLGPAGWYQRASDVPRDDDILEFTGWSWGDSYNDFWFCMFAVEDERRIHVVWRMNETPSCVFPPMTNNVRHARVHYCDFDNVVDKFVSDVGYAALVQQR